MLVNYLLLVRYGSLKRLSEGSETLKGPRWKWKPLTRWQVKVLHLSYKSVRLPIFATYHFITRIGKNDLCKLEHFRVSLFSARSRKRVECGCQFESDWFEKAHVRASVVRMTVHLVKLAKVVLQYSVGFYVRFRLEALWSKEYTFELWNGSFIRLQEYRILIS